MAGAEENGAAIGDWRAPIPSPRSFFSAFLSEEIVSRSFSQIINGTEPSVVDSEKENVLDKKENDAVGFSGVFPAGSEKTPTGRNGGSIAERRAAWGGFNAPRLNTARFRTTSPLNSPVAVRSPYLTIPPGLSPTTLLDSPIVLLNSQAQPSPTTGTYTLPPFSHESLMSVPAADDPIEARCVDDDEPSFVFKPHVNPVSVPCLPSIGNQVSSTSNQAKQLGMDGIQCQTEVQSEVEFDYQAEFLKRATANDNTTDSPSDLEMPDRMIAQASPMAVQTCTPSVTKDQTSQHEEQLLGEDSGRQQLLEGDERGPNPPTGTGRPSEDGYNWRKYGQKQVKGSEYPRSYYKCTHQNCQVKKKVECSRDGQITEIIYKGAHNHPKPQPSRRTGIGSAFVLNDMPERPEGLNSYAKAGGGSVWRGIQQGSKDKSGTDWRGDGLERTSSASVVTDLSDPLSSSQGKHLSLLEPADTPELSSTLASHEDEEDRNTQGSISLGDDADDEESDSKRRKKDSSLNPIEPSMASRAVREPRVVVQTTSEVDILDDGYRWRKYGQKVVKGNPNPRSYYKCTSAGCSVRKHVERASHDLKSVITTYEGKHNHEVPAARNSSHCNNSVTGSGPSAASAPISITRPASANLPKPEPQAQDLAPRFERNPEQLGNEFLKPGYLGNLSDIKLGASSACYDIKLPPLQPLAFASYGLKTNLKEVHQVAPDFPMSFPMGLSHRPANFSMAGLGFSGKPGGLVQSFLGQQVESEMRFLRPKEEQEEPAYETPRLPTNNPSNVFPSIYHQTMGGFPL